MSAKGKIAAWATVAIVAFELAAEVTRLGVCLAHPPGPATAACYERIGPVSSAIQALRVAIEGEPAPPVVPTPAPAPPVEPPPAETQLDKLRKLPSL
jgi:hypothetical protein